jgi:hypothetical protein
MRHVEAVIARRDREVRPAFAVELGKECLAAEKLDHGPLSLNDGETSVQRIGAARVHDRKSDAAGCSDAPKIQCRRRAGGDRYRNRGGLRTVFGGRIETIVAGRKLHLVPAAMTDRPGVGLAILFDHHHGLIDRRARAIHDRTAQCPGRQMLALDLGAQHRRQVSAAPDLQPGLESPVLAGRQRMRPEHVARSVGDMVDVRRMQSDAPIAVIRDHAIGQRTLGRPLLRIPNARHAEQIAAFGPQRKARQQVG